MRSAALALLLLLLPLPALGAAASVHVVGGLTRESTVALGAKSEGELLLQNSSDQPARVRTYQTDYLFYADGRNLYGEPGTDPRSNASWISFSPRELEVAAKSTTAVHYQLQVPATGDLVGTYWSILMVEPMAGPAPAPAMEKDKVAVGITTVIRYAVQIVTHVGEGGSRELRFTEAHLATQEGRRRLEVAAENSGQSGLSPLLWVELFDLQGARLGRFEATRRRIYPGCSVRYQIDLSTVAPGEYHALLVADNGDEHVFGARYKLEVK
jgi:hypothetical protein